MISYLELLERIKEGNAPKRVEVVLNSGSRIYQLEDDGHGTYYYYIENEKETDDNFKGYLTECLLESDMLEEKIRLIEDKSKKIEKIHSITSAVGKVNESNIEEYIHRLFRQQTEFYFKLDEIIDYINKGDNYE